MSYEVESLQHAIRNQEAWLEKRQGWVHRPESTRLERWVRAALARNRAALARLQIRCVA